MIVAVADTHAALWYLHANPLLSTTARRFIDGAALVGNIIVISPISLAEILYLVEKKRLPASAYEDLKLALQQQEYVINEAPFHTGIVDAMKQIPRAVVPDLPDRIVAATAIYLNVPVISRDEQIRASRIPSIW